MSRDLHDDRRVYHEYRSHQVLGFIAILDGAVLAGISQLAGWSRPLTNGVEFASVMAVVAALLSLGVIGSVYLMREGMAYADLKEVSDVLGEPPENHPRESPWRHRFLGNSAFYATVLAFLSALAFGGALITSILG